MLVVIDKHSAKDYYNLNLVIFLFGPLASLSYLSKSLIFMYEEEAQ